PLAGRPLAAHVLATVRTLAPRAIAVVTGFGAEAVETALAGPDLVFVRQDPPLGTGDAVRVALKALPADGVTLVGLGDVPLVPGEALAALIALAGEGKLAAEGRLALLTARVANPFGLGRVVRGSDGGVQKIVEERDASDTERAIDEINTGFLAAPTTLLAKWVARLTPHNAQREYYLTDIVAMAVAEGIAVAAHTVEDEASVAGVTDRAQLAALERIVQRRSAHKLMVAGTSISDPERIDVRGSLECGRDVSIDVGCVFEGDITLADGASIG